ncbi:hypothetical protein CWI39_0365p0020 [Hamiltosporidium magnivora]|uniref:Uncharacterized protein n=1 Tax=Hamiltosporidium magnivora TaxID=148818 RepID=A0A4Q9LIQ3_9MICR|nr:hypothetical protein CWI39_0365p0020 [Hamiltosporidium magnivora]
MSYTWPLIFIGYSRERDVIFYAAKSKEEVYSASDIDETKKNCYCEMIRDSSDEACELNYTEHLFSRNKEIEISSLR